MHREEGGVLGMRQIWRVGASFSPNSSSVQDLWVLTGKTGLLLGDSPALNARRQLGRAKGVGASPCGQSSQSAVYTPSQVSRGPLLWARSLKNIMNETQTTNEQNPRKLLTKLIARWVR